MIRMCDLPDTNVGRCTDMCPQREMFMREKQCRLHPFEIVPGTNKLARPKADPRRTVKEFCRSAAGKKGPSEDELRPPHVLMKTLDYLVNRLLTRQDVSWLEIYNFASDRMHCIRQDMTLQQLSPRHCIAILEPIVRFHIYASYRLRKEPLHHFDPHLNNSHVQQCLKRLLVCYDESDEMLDNREEFESLYLLHNLGSMEALFHAISLPKHVRQHKQVQHALSINRAFLEHNFIRLFLMTEKCSILQNCAIHQHFPVIRKHALKILNTAYSSKNTKFPVAVLKQWLKFTSEGETEQFCQWHGLSVVNRMVQFSKAAYKFPSDQPPVRFDCSLDNVDVPAEKIGDVIWANTHKLSEQPLK